MKHPTLSKNQTEWMQKRPTEIWYFKCRVCEIRFSMRQKNVEACIYCKNKDVVRIPERAFLGKRPGNGRSKKVFPR